MEEGEINVRNGWFLMKNILLNTILSPLLSRGHRHRNATEIARYGTHIIVTFVLQTPPKNLNRI